MSVFDTFSNLMYQAIRTNPEKARKLLLLAFRGFDWTEQLLTL